MMLQCKSCSWSGKQAKTIRATKRLPERTVCPDCGSTDIGPMPKTAEIGRCAGCGGSSFGLFYRDHEMIRRCRACGMLLNLHTMEITEGDSKS